MDCIKIYLTFVVNKLQTCCMIISEIQMKAIRQLISKADKQQLSLHTQKSVRTIEAVLQSDRINDEIEQAILLTAKQNLFALSNVIRDIEQRTP